MCEKCVEIDKKIDHYRWLAVYVNDERTAKGINELIQRHEAEKRAAGVLDAGRTEASKPGDDPPRENDRVRERSRLTRWARFDSSD
jgi:hypothetical protein